MLQSMRNNLKSLSWILWIVVIALSVYVFANWGAQGQLGAPTSVVAWVDGDEILYKEFVEQYRNLDDQYRQAYGKQYTPEMAKMIGVPRRALDNLINSRVLLHEADRLGIHVSKDEVGKQILNLPVFKDDKGNFVGRERYQQYLKAYGKRVQDFERNMADDIVMTKLGDLVNSSVMITGAELERIYREQNEKIAFDYVTFRAAQFLQEAQAAVTDEDVQAHFEANKESYRTPLKRRIDFVRFSTFAYRDGIEVTPEEIQAYYDSHIADYTQEEEVRASHILIGITGTAQRTKEEALARAQEVEQKLKDGADFAAMAKEYSDDKGSAVRGGDLDFFPRGRMVDEFANAAFDLEVGQVSEPVETVFGYHIIKLTDRKPEVVKTLEQVHDDIENKLKFEGAQEMAVSKAEAFAAAAKKQGELKTAAEQEGYALSDSGFFANDPNAQIKGLGPATAVTGVTFSLQIGDISDAVSTAEGMIVFQVMEEQSPRIPELDEVKKQVVEDVANEKALDLAHKRGEAFRSEVTPKTFDAVCKKEDLTISSQAMVSRASAPNNFIVDKTSDDFDKLFSYDSGQVTEPLLSRSGDLVVCMVTDKVNFDPKAFAAARDNLLRTEMRNRSNRLYTTLVSNARKQLTDAGKIKIRQDFLDSLEENN